jgi:hypothetical protein
VKALHKRLVDALIFGAELVSMVSARRGPAFEYREGVPVCASDSVRQPVPLEITPALVQPRFAIISVASGCEGLFVQCRAFQDTNALAWRETGGVRASVEGYERTQRCEWMRRFQ